VVYFNKPVDLVYRFILKDFVQFTIMVNLIIGFLGYFQV